MNRKELDDYLRDGINDFQSGGSGLMGIAIIPGNCWDNMIAAGDRGDTEARAATFAIRDWMIIADKAIEAGTHPACTKCAKVLHKGNVGGWGLVRRPKPKDQSGGLVLAFCAKCIERPGEELLRAVMDTLEEEGVGKVERIQ
jgi:hypothetical protein